MIMQSIEYAGNTWFSEKKGDRKFDRKIHGLFEKLTVQSRRSIEEAARRMDIHILDSFELVLNEALSQITNSDTAKISHRKVWNYLRVYFDSNQTLSHFENEYIIPAIQCEMQRGCNYCEYIFCKKLKRLRPDITERVCQLVRTGYFQDNEKGWGGWQDTDEVIVASKLEDKYFLEYLERIYIPVIEEAEKSLMENALAPLNKYEKKKDNKRINGLDKIQGGNEEIKLFQDTKYSKDKLKEAKKWTYQQKGKFPKKSLQGIAGEAVEKYFPNMPKFSGKKTKWGAPILNLDWKHLRDTIRSSISQKKHYKGKKKKGDGRTQKIP